MLKKKENIDLIKGTKCLEISITIKHKVINDSIIKKCPIVPIEATEIQTYYESLYLTKGKAITYIKFRYNN